MSKYNGTILRFFLLSCLWPFLCHGAILYRAGTRDPMLIKSLGGFICRGQTTPGVVAPDTSLWKHVQGHTDGLTNPGIGIDEDGYVSTTKSFDVAELYLRQYFKGTGWIHMIKDSPNFIDVAGTLGKYYNQPSEAEVAAIGSISWDQIIRYFKVEDGYSLDDPIENPDYNAAKYENLSGGGSRPELAGFPAGHPAWNEDPWKAFSSCSKKRSWPRAFLEARQSCHDFVTPTVAASQYMSAHCPGSTC